MPPLVLCTGAGRVFHELKSLSIFCWRDGSQRWNPQADFTSVNAAGCKSSSAGAVIVVRSIVLTPVPKPPVVKRCGHPVAAISKVQKDASNMPNALIVTGSVKIK
jgi:hypothetical protein